MYTPNVPKVIVFLGTVSLILLYILLLYVGYLVFWPVRTLEVKNPIMQVNTPIVKQGGALIYQLDYCRYDIDSATVYRTVFGRNGIVYPLAPVNSVTYYGCRSADVYLMIPNSIPPGTYHVEMRVNIEVNLLRKEVINTRTVEFNIVE